MFKELLEILFPSRKSRARLVVRGLLSVDDIMNIHQEVKGWGLPGWMQAVPGDHLSIEIEGPDRSIQVAIGRLSQTGPLLHGNTLEVNWLPYRGDMAEFRFAA